MSFGPSNAGICLIRILHLQLFCNSAALNLEMTYFHPGHWGEQAKRGKARTDKPHTSFTKGQWHFEMQKIAARFSYDPSDTVAF